MPVTKTRLIRPRSWGREAGPGKARLASGAKNGGVPVADQGSTERT
jgi:hypothetical protein